MVVRNRRQRSPHIQPGIILWRSREYSLSVDLGLWTFVYIVQRSYACDNVSVVSWDRGKSTSTYCTPLASLTDCSLIISNVGKGFGVCGLEFCCCFCCALFTLAFCLRDCSVCAGCPEAEGSGVLVASVDESPWPWHIVWINRNPAHKLCYGSTIPLRCFGWYLWDWSWAMDVVLCMTLLTKFISQVQSAQ